jgi:catechol 2,3-dioxygenase-like lactoylglutathione lyase family enzyme
MTTTAAQVLEIAMVGFTVSDMTRAVDFYERVLGFKKVAETQVTGDAYDTLSGILAGNMRIVHLRLGEQTVELTEYLSHNGRPIPVPWRANNHWFQHVAIVVSDMEKAYEQLCRHRVGQISIEPQTFPESNVAAAGIKALKFCDPDNHALELIWFPVDKGSAHWRRPSDRLFLGIDHTAITVSDTEQSLRFYRDLLGLTAAGGSVNTGITQERLDGVLNPRVRITAVVPETSPPFIEFLHYESPPDGRPFPLDTNSADLWHWQTSLVVEDVAAAAKALRAAGVRFVSPDVVTVPNSQLGFSRAIMVRDPDAHAMRLVQR